MEFKDVGIYIGGTSYQLAPAMEAEEAPVSDGHKAILNKRLDSYEKNPGNNVSWAEVKERAKKVL